ncbi:HNH endonuclease signature motif containing protein [Citrobacter freundii]|uniref:HNH endonuclease signature motif containing protein n=1 Tax=Citrobacter freundii TaxID=546 RepID=UPI002B2477FD|nr:HNH endonuclease signature motif containing protein [Citrobacter freundii]MEB2478223.1 HNH endonuclease signature motif containing protein [Citrobacter freundii]
MLINEYHHANKHMLTRHGWECKKWKPNHFAWGNDTHDGCFVRYKTGKRDQIFNSFFREAVTRAAALLNIPEDEIRYACNKALEDFQHLSIRSDGRVIIGYLTTLTNQNTPAEIRAVLEKHDLHGSMKIGAKIAAPQVNNSPQMKKPKKSKKSLRNARRERLKAWREEYAVAPGERPKRIKVTGLSKGQLRMLAPEVAAGLPPDMLKEFREWYVNLNDLHSNKMLDEKIDGFLSSSWEEWTAEPVVFIPLHDAHVVASRKRRAARLKAMRRVVVREGQARFSQQVNANFDGCVLTGTTEHLEAAHILPDRDYDHMHPSNGLLLVGFLHRAFDDLMFTINPLTLTVFVAPAFRAWLNIHGKQIRDGNIWKIDRAALAHHWEYFKEKNALNDAA